MIADDGAPILMDFGSSIKWVPSETVLNVEHESMFKPANKLCWSR